MGERVNARCLDFCSHDVAAVMGQSKEGVGVIFSFVCAAFLPKVNQPGTSQECRQCPLAWLACKDLRCRLSWYAPASCTSSTVLPSHPQHTNACLCHYLITHIADSQAVGCCCFELLDLRRGQLVAGHAHPEAGTLSGSMAGKCK